MARLFCSLAFLALALALAGLLAAGAISPPQGAEAQNPTGRLARTSGPAKVQVLDKVTARVSTLTLPIGRTLRYKTLSITAEACWRALPLEIPESIAWLRVSERSFARAGENTNNTANRSTNALQGTQDTQEEQQVFSGWLYASSPSVSSVEHPVYDLVLLSCEGEETD